MTLRMKSRYYTGLTGGGTYSPSDPVLPGCRLEGKRKKLNSLYGQISSEAFDAEVEKMYKEAKNEVKKGARKGVEDGDENDSGINPTLLSMMLEHGDIVVMHGAEMQKYYEVRPFSPCDFS